MTEPYILIFKLMRGEHECLERVQYEFDDEAEARFVFGALSDADCVDDERNYYADCVANGDEPIARTP